MSEANIYLDARAQSMVFDAVVDAQIRTDVWCQEGEERLNLPSSFSKIEPSVSVYLRPDDEIQIEQVRMKIKREDSKQAGLVGEIQVKSSGQTDIGSGNEEQQTNGEILESQITIDQLASTPNPQPSHHHRTIETVIETPAASSRHQQPPINLSPILSSIAENAIKGNEDSQFWGSDPNNREIMSRLKSVAEPRTRSSSPKRSAEPKNGDGNAALVETNIAAGENVIDLYSESQDQTTNFAIEPGKLTNNFQADLRQTSPIPLDVSKNDTQTSTRERGDLLLQAASGNQGRLSSQPPSSPEAKPSTYSPHVSNSAISVIDSRNTSQKSPTTVSITNSVHNELKRKRGANDSQDSTRNTIHVEIPMVVHAPDSKPVSKKQKKKPAAPAQGLNGSLAKRHKSNSTTPTAAARSKSTKSQDIESSRESIEPSSSTRSTRSSSLNFGAKILYASSTTVDKQSKLMSFLRKKKVKSVKSVNDCDFLCVGKGELKKTSNLVMAVVCGKQVINDDWVLQSAAEGELLDFDNFLARDAVREAEWGINLDQAIQRGKDGVKPLAGLAFYFSPAAKKELGKGYSELEGLAFLAGATSVQATLPKKSNNTPHFSTSIVITAQNDRDLSTLTAGGWRCYSKDIMTLSILRGQLDADSDEFLISS